METCDGGVVARLCPANGRDEAWLGRDGMGVGDV